MIFILFLLLICCLYSFEKSEKSCEDGQELFHTIPALAIRFSINISLHYICGPRVATFRLSVTRAKLYEYIKIYKYISKLDKFLERSMRC